MCWVVSVVVRMVCREASVLPAAVMATHPASNSASCGRCRIPMWQNRGMPRPKPMIVTIA